MGRKRVLQPNKFVISEEEGLVYIHLSGKWGTGKIAITDLESFYKYDMVNHVWSCTKSLYAYTVVDGEMIFMHRLVSGNNSSLHTDHIGGSEGEKSLDNRACNLRICTNRENQHNAKVRVDNVTGYKNVNFQNGKYRCQIKINGIKEYFGIFDTAAMCAYAYNIVIPFFSDVYQLNIIPPDALSQVDKDIVEHTVKKRLDEFNKKRQIVINPDFNKWTDKVQRGELVMEYNPLTEAKKLLQKSMEQKKRTPKDVKESLEQAIPKERIK